MYDGVCPGRTCVNRKLGLAAPNQSYAGGLEIGDITSYGQTYDVTTDQRRAFILDPGSACGAFPRNDNVDEIPFEEPDVRYERITG